ncbi:DUF4430 domain-containing protein [Pullulanibacillus sp. KACC 23026]|uniref:DUF4430 domain-containing protein n=1 Tax=Pullulanibacillus sp. KACC 23026 TaxID=3028315 RepID=UPI0023AE8A44|nr:DUF4430 domain-containing protein [Pullulanibacillus sp. KACC 23026]WEG11766.1 DUF4430 domain-containing protein [Pullulanibacillus sp. KACC 23026]
MQSFRNTIKFLFIMAFVLVQGTLYFSSAHAATTNQAKVEVVGQNGKIIQAETPEPVDGSQSALDLLKAAVGEGNVDAPGGFVSTIDGVTTPADYSNYWTFYVNGVSAPMGANSYKPKDGDQLLFEYHPGTGTLNDEVSVTIPDKTYGTTSTFVKVQADETVQTVLKNMQAFYNVTLSGQDLQSIGDFKSDSTHTWNIVDDHQGTKTTVSDISQAKVQGGDQLTITLKESDVATPSQPSQTNVTQITSAQLSNAINQANSYVLKNGVSEWEAISLAKSGKTVPASYLKQVTQTVRDAKGSFHSVTDTERYTLGILAAGGDPTNVGGYNLVKNIYNGDLTKQGLNGVLFGLIALNSADFPVPNHAKWTKVKLETYILKAQNTDGGWAWDGSKTSDLDTTGMALTALSQSHSAETKTAIQKAEVYIADQMKADKLDNSSTAAQLIIGLASNGVDPNSADYVLKDGKTLMAYLLSYQQKDGGFDWQANDESSFSTQQAFLALAADHQLLQQGYLYSFKWTPVKASDPAKVSKSTVSPAKQTASLEKPATSADTTGAALPETATFYYNYLILGFLLIGVGLSARFWLKKGIH